MAAYFAMRIKMGKLSYSQVMSVPAYKAFKEDIDAILIADGHADLITE